MPDVAELRRINELLGAAAVARDMPDTAHTFDLRALPPLDRLEDVVATLAEGTNWVVSVSSSDWHAVEKALASWIGEVAPHVLSEILAVLGSPLLVHRIEAEPPPDKFMEPWYEAAWDDFALSGPDGRFLLHLGVSD